MTPRLRTALLTPLAASLLATLTSPAVLAGELDSFESDSTRYTPPSKPHHRHHHRGCDSPAGCLGEELAAEAVSAVADVMLFHGMETSEARINYTGENVIPREYGEALIPFVRIDAHYQETNLDAEAADLRLELGSGALAFHARHTRYYENNPRDELGYTQMHVMARLSYSDSLGLNLGIGGASLEGDSYTTGPSFTYQVLIHPSRHFGLEIRPTVSYFNETPFYDWDASLLFSQGAGSLVLGYRSLENPFSEIYGPYAGLSYRY